MYAPKSKDKVSHPKLLDSISGIAKVVCGQEHCFAITSNLEVLVWGRNDKGQLGIFVEPAPDGAPITEDQYMVHIPTVIRSLLDKEIDNIATGVNHSFGWSSKTGDVYAWGSGASGKLGFGNDADTKEPSLLECFKEASSVGIQVRKIVCGDEHSLAVLEHTEEEENDSNSNNNCLFVWGCARNWQLGLKDDVLEDVFEPHGLDPDPWNGEIRDIAASNDYSSAVTASGSVYTWGTGKFGRLGYETETKRQKEPRLVEKLQGIHKVSLGTHHAMAILNNGNIFSWGRGVYGQLGHDGAANEDYPKLVKGLSQKKIVDICCGENHTLAVSDAGETYSWGAGQFGQLGHGDVQRQATPLKITVLESVKVVQVSAGKRHSAVLDEKGHVYVWGSNEFCQLGLKTIAGANNGQRVFPLPIETTTTVENNLTFTPWSRPKSTTNTKAERESKFMEELTERNNFLAERVKELELKSVPNKQISQQQVMYDLTSLYVSKVETECAVRDGQKNEAIMKNIRVDAVAKEYKQKIKDLDVEDLRTIMFCMEMFEKVCELRKKANYALSQT